MTPLNLPVSHPPLYHSHLISNKSTVQRGAWPVQGSLRNQALEWPSVDGSFRTGHPEGGASNLKPRRLSGCVMRKARQLNEAERQRARSRATLGLRSALAGHLADHPQRFSCIIGSAYDEYRFDGAQIRIAEVYQSTARTGPQGSISDVFRLSTRSGEVVGSAVGETC